MKRILTLFLLVLIVSSVTSMAQKRWDELSFPEMSKFNVPKVESFKLKNGITVYMMENKELPLINLNVTVRTGEVLVPGEKAGLASITGTTMRSGGSAGYPSDKLNELLENRAASIETFIGFGSGGARMNVLKEDFKDLLPVFIDVLQNPLFPQEKIDLAKTQQKSSISRRNDDAQSVAFREFEQVVYGENSVYARDVEYETIDAISREDILAFHEKSFVASNMMISVIGDFNKKDMKKHIQKAFSSIPKGKALDLEYPEVDYTFEKSINLVDKSDVNQSVVVMGHKGGKRNEDYAALQVMNQILSGGFSGRLMQNVRTDLGLAYAVFGGYQSNINYDGTFYTGVMTKSETTAEAIDAIMVQVKRLQEEPVGEEELNETRERILNSVVFKYDSKAKVLNEKVSNTYNGLPDDYFEQYIEDIKKLKPADINRVAKKYLRPEDFEILVVGNKSEIGNQLDKYGTVNEIDISIPVPGGEKKDVTGDATAAKLWLSKMKEQLLGDKTVSTITMEGSVTQFSEQIPGGKMSMNRTGTMSFPSSVSATIQSPQGQITLEVKEGKGVMKMGELERPLPPQQVESLQKSLTRHYLSIAQSYETMEAVFTGKESKDGEEYAVVEFTGKTPFTLYIHTVTMLPGMMSYSDMNPMTGAPTTVTDTFSEWKTQDGVQYAAKTVGSSEGKVATEQTITTISFE